MWSSDEPSAEPPVRVFGPTAAVLPLLLDSPHSGTLYPADFALAVPLPQLRQAEDTHVDRLWAEAIAHGATLVAARFPRSYIDVNRARDDIDPELLDSPWPPEAEPQPRPSAKAALGKGLIWRHLDDGTPIYARPLAPSEIQRRITDFYDPYRRALDEAALALYRRFGALWHLNCHSMPSVADRYSTAHPGQLHPDIVLGDRHGQASGAEFVELLRDFFRARGYSVTVNDPYAGVDIVHRLGWPAARRHSVQVEINRQLYMDERSLQPHSGWHRLRGDLGELLVQLARFVGMQLDLRQPA
jgi:N-formylglutamate deformylase